jgi:S-adenosylhomocysteine hydrolase
MEVILPILFWTISGAGSVCKGISEEATTGVHRLYERVAKGTLPFLLSM